MNMAFRAVLVLVFGFAVFIGILAGHKQPATTASANPQPTPTVLPPLPAGVVVIGSGGNGGVFSPAVIHVKVGQTVTWANLLSTNFSVTADNGAFDSGVIGYHQIFRWTPKKPGRYVYGSFLNPNVQGVVVVS